VSFAPVPSETSGLATTDEEKSTPTTTVDQWPGGIGASGKWPSFTLRRARPALAPLRVKTRPMRRLAPLALVLALTQSACSSEEDSPACSSLCVDLDAFRRFSCEAPPVRMCNQAGAPAIPLSPQQVMYVEARCNDCSKTCAACSAGLPKR
jgi:hypothetical protein